MISVVTFSKYAWVVPIKDKMGKTKVEAMKTVLKEGRTPKSSQTDTGTEFKNRHFQKYLNSQNIYFFVERFQRTLKTKMWKYFTHHRTLHYLEVLQKFVHGYNHAYHRIIKRVSGSVNAHNEGLVSEALYGTLPKHANTKFKVGDIVRISKTKRTFETGYLPNWTQEQFKITRLRRQVPVTYKIEDLGQEPFKGSFYSQQLQRVDPEHNYEIGVGQT